MGIVFLCTELLGKVDLPIMVVFLTERPRIATSWERAMVDTYLVVIVE